MMGFKLYFRVYYYCANFKDWIPQLECWVYHFLIINSWSVSKFQSGNCEEQKRDRKLPHRSRLNELDPG